MPRAINGLYEFGPFRLDLERRVLTRDNRAVPLPPKTFDLLVLLVQSPSRAFSKRELMDALWADTFIEEANLSFQVSVLRKALGADGARWVETVPKHGYRFGADVLATVPPATSAAEPLSSETSEPSAVILKRSHRKVWLAGATIVAASLAVGAFLTLVRKPGPAVVRPSAALAVPLTAYPGHELAPSLSPDGSRVAFSWNGPTQDNYDIYVKVAGPGEPVRLTKTPAPEDWPAWSPDGRFIAFIRFTSPNTVGDLVVIPALGGAERTIATIRPTPIPRNVRPISNLSWTPDGRWLAFGGATSPNGGPGIWLIAVDGSEQRHLTEPPEGHDVSPVVSPDGRHLAFLRARTVGRVAIFLVPLTEGLAPSGTPRQLTGDDAGVIGLAWTANGRDVVFSSGGHLGLSRMAKISEVSQSSRAPEPEFLPFGAQATAISIAGTGRLVYSAQFRDTALYQVALAGPPGTPTALDGFASTFDEQTPHYSQDGQRLAFASTRSGAEEIWIANRDGSNPLQLTSMGGPQCSNPQWSPDGRMILFDSRRAGSADLYLLWPESGKLTRLTDHAADEGEARWSRDGQWIYFASDRTGRDEVWRMPAAGGAPAQITRQGGTAAVEAGDGFLYYANTAGSPTSIWRVPIDGDGEVRFVDGLSYSLNFAVGKRGLYFVALDDAGSKASVDFIDFRTRQRLTLVHLEKPFWLGTTLSPDERSLVIPLVDSAGSNLMVVDGFR